jgi:anti-sigma regulatory factor (Ser/Thr protein kinase)
MRPNPSYERIWAVDADVSVPLLQVLARQAAETVGATNRERAEFATAVTEAATNILRHATRGVVVVRAFVGPPRELEFEALDHGPGIADPGAALVDGFSRGKALEIDQSRARGMGCGFGAIQRLMGRLSVESEASGTRVLAQKRLGGRW